MRLVGLVIVAAIAFAGCGDSGRGPVSGPSTSRLSTSAAGSCEDLAADDLFRGEASVVIEGRGEPEGLSCTLEFAGDATALERLGYDSLCPAQASIVVAFNYTDDEWVLDQTETSELDNGDCLVQGDAG